MRACAAASRVRSLRRRVPRGALPHLCLSALPWPQVPIWKKEIYEGAAPEWKENKESAAPTVGQMMAAKRRKRKSDGTFESTGQGAGAAGSSSNVEEVPAVVAEPEGEEAEPPIELTTALAKAYASGDEEEGVMVVDSEVVADEVEVVD